MLTVTIEQAAKIFEVTPKTIRQWIRDEGLPTARTGGKGPGQGALVDLARIGCWQRERKGRRHSVADAFAKQVPERPNPLRVFVELHHHQALAALGLAFRDWTEEPGQSATAFDALGLTPEQARRVAAALWLHAALYLGVYTFDRFEQDVAEKTGGADLDDFWSLATEGDVRSEWHQTDATVPEFVLASLPAATVEALAKSAPKPQRAPRRRRS